MKNCENIGRARVNLDVFDVGLNQFQPILGWRSCDEDETRTVRLALFTERAAPDSTLDEWAVLLHAKVSFGAGAVMTDVFVDYKNGVQLTLPAGGLNVSAAVIERTTSTLGAVERLMTLGAVIAHGDAPARSLNTFTTPIQTIAGGAVGFFPIPPFAYAVTFASVDAASFFTALTTFSQSGSGTGAVLNNITGDVFQTVGMRQVGWPLVEGSRVLGIVNSAGGPFSARVQFLIDI